LAGSRSAAAAIAAESDRRKLRRFIVIVCLPVVSV
jgi:hypothetical protein